MIGKMAMEGGHDAGMAGEIAMDDRHDGNGWGGQNIQSETRSNLIQWQFNPEAISGISI